ncbi:hypothetical protein BKA61DRAFT_576920 [Leptodontidium sp. MPI-SDFR-AT-0119]|nr:hypothetical protein BKA61DRAFT_576920 [Leptodontidium sp. MPI-SDFR-AT-0119]
MEEYPLELGKRQKIVRLAIRNICHDNDLDWYIGGQRITYQGISNALNIKYNNHNPVTEIPFDAEFVLRTIREDDMDLVFADLYVLDGTETSHSKLGLMTADAIPDEYIQGDSRQWQVYEIKAVRRLLDGYCSRPVDIKWGTSIKAGIILEDLQNIGASRRWPPLVYRYSIDALERTLKRENWYHELFTLETMGIGYRYGPPQSEQPQRTAQDRQSLARHDNPECGRLEAPRQPQTGFGQGFQKQQQQQQSEQQRQHPQQPQRQQQQQQPQRQQPVHVPTNQRDPNHAKPPSRQNFERLPYYTIYPEFSHYNFPEEREYDPMEHFRRRGQ